MLACMPCHHPHLFVAAAALCLCIPLYMIHVTSLLPQLYARLQPRIYDWRHRRNSAYNATLTADRLQRQGHSGRVSALPYARHTPRPTTSPFFPKESVIVVQPDGQEMWIGIKCAADSDDGGEGKAGATEGGSQDGAATPRTNVSTSPSETATGHSIDPSGAVPMVAREPSIVVSIEMVHRPHRSHRTPGSGRVHRHASVGRTPAGGQAGGLGGRVGAGGLGSMQSAGSGTQVPLRPRSASQLPL